MLNGKCKKNFDKWIREPNQKELYSIIESLEDENYYVKDIPLVFLYGVLVDFFDSVGIEINVSPLDFPLTNNFWCSVKGKKTEYFKTRQEARTQAIIKANEIYNKG